MSNPNQYQKASQVPKESIISSLREELSILKDIHNQTVKAGIAGFEAMVAENAVLKVDNELLRHLSFRDERNKLKEQLAESQDDNTKLRSAVSRMADENIEFKEQLATVTAQRDLLKGLVAEVEGKYFAFLKEKDVDAEKFKAEGDMYGWNFHMGEKTGAVWMHLFMTKLLKATSLKGE